MSGIKASEPGRLRITEGGITLWSGTKTPEVVVLSPTVIGHRWISEIGNGGTDIVRGIV